ncbi:TorF family putative porin [Novosphingobium sp. EMRT-2]|uniref:TorF family putative porin n=1 Tax=Novosphingobium sp. EMRT-2 TaxID=2571749 RepID=UPI0010BD7617|nr:TorF family putative porin [Novosphingobium sp. EMRT-2]QCI92566.1 hypothetical protein FA702_02685 [Novosphingobium sp. EMRT-2]
MVIRVTMLALPALMAGAAIAQAQGMPSFGVEATTDEVRRGLSWSEGKASASADAAVSLGGFDLSARMAATRGAARHLGADAVADLTLARRWTIGLFDVSALVSGHLFAGAADTAHYAELGLGASYALGPARVGAGARYAPRQGAIGGDNLYLYGDAALGIPATPFSLSASLGHSRGSVRDPARAARLRPDGAYTDWRIGADYARGPLLVGLDYTGTDVKGGAPGGHAGDRVIGRVRLSF